MTEQAQAAPASGIKRRGFASMTPERRAELARAGGLAAQAEGTAHRWNPQSAAAAGRKGGQRVSKDRAHMANIGRKGGFSVSKDREHMARIGKVGGQMAHGANAQ